MKSLLPILILSPWLSAGDFSKDVLIPEPSSEGWSLSVAAGPSWRHFGDVRYQGGSRSQNLLIPSFIGGNSLNFPSIGSEDSAGDRSYNDGFVNQDPGTAFNGLTWNWGYTSTTQVGTDTLAYTATGARSDYSEGSSLSSIPSEDRDLSNAGFNLDFIFQPPATSELPLENILVSLSYFGDERNFGFSNFSGQQLRNDYRLDITDTYDTTGLIVPLRDNYAGTFAGPGPKLDNLPADRVQNDVLIGSENATFSNSVSSSIELNAFSMAVGPTFGESYSSGWSWHFSMGTTFSIYKWSAKERETLAVSVNGGQSTDFARYDYRESGTEFALGLFGRFGVTRELPADWFTSLSCQAEHSLPFDVEVGPSSYRIDPTGYSFSLLAGRRF